ncbi:MAG: flagellar biosynthetic protein FliR, partial [Bdellovibrionales bacterium]
FALSMAGELISVSLGLASAQVYNPFSGNNGQVLEQFFSLFGMIVFLALNGHHVFVTALVESFQTLPVAKLSIEFGGLAELAKQFQQIFVIMIKMAAPVVITLFIVNMSMAIIGRAVPQINVLVTSFPVTIMIGLVVLIISMPLMSMEMSLLLQSTSTELFKLMRAL